MRVSLLIKFSIIARLECNRCKKLKNSRKKYLDPITGLYIEKLPKGFTPTTTLKSDNYMMTTSQTPPSLSFFNNQYTDKEYQNQGFSNFTPYKMNAIYKNHLTPPLNGTTICNNMLYSSNISNHNNYNQSNYMLSQGIQKPQFSMMNSSVPEFVNQINFNPQLRQMQGNSNYYMNNGFLSNFGANQYYVSQPLFNSYAGLNSIL